MTSEEDKQLQSLLQTSRELSARLEEVNRQIEAHKAGIPGEFVPPPVAATPAPVRRAPRKKRSR